MKRTGYIFLGAAIGVALTLSASAAADGISNLIGKKVQSEATVTLDGKKIDTAIVIDNKSYAPIRSISEASGKKVSYEGGEVRLETPKKEPAKEPIEIIDPRKQEPPLDEAGKKNIIEAINTRLMILSENKSFLIDRLSVLNSDPNPSEEDKKTIAVLQKDLANTQAEIESLEAKKAELQK